ncbi:MAG: bifunctional nicotinamidase/pyrazinamidase [Parachlamydiaceae bacterium]|nr:bifunctional nicotinamidase/pyrazinamidase [Parachlamydiaceae bacterium]
MNTLLLVDIQNDFIPGGTLPVKDGDRIIPLVKEMVWMPFDLIVATKDWHPTTHASFADNHGQEPGKHITLDGIDQILWPRHCVQGTWGAEFASGWDTTQVEKVVYKGTDPNIDSYSTFFDNAHLRSTGLEHYLKGKGVKKIFIVGLATDYCVLFSVLDAIQLGFDPYVVLEGCKGVNIHPADSEHALEAMKKAGAHLISFKDLSDVMKTKAI